MLLIIDGHSFRYEIENLCRVFFREQIKVSDDINVWNNDELCIITRLDNNTISVEIAGTDLMKSKSIPDSCDKEYEMAVLLFEVLVKYTGYMPPWGILTGVRPSKLMNNFIDELGPDQAKRYYKEKLFVSENKTNMAFSVANEEKNIIESSRDNSFSLYVSIPFCPTRCSYCSFVSHSIEKSQKLIEPYVELLCKELEQAGKIANKLGLRLETIYYGGGTPTTLSAEQIENVIKTIDDNFDLSTLREYTIEAGRPDTVTKEKLEVIKSGGVNRISINPQTFNDDVLKEIGRKHTSVQTIEAYNLAREVGIKEINMDLIAGLPKDNIESFGMTMDKVLGLNPENITVHTLALKRSSKIVSQSMETSASDVTENMVDLSYEKLISNGYNPYYMYRQSQSVGNLENIGWSRNNLNCLYNIFMMEEVHSILAVGAGAVTKLKQPKGKYIERIFNFKYPYEYNARYDEILKRKESIMDFYDKYSV